ncbi:protein ABHD13 [Schistocerca cancellata]|uniref:protein ABHD13 n=1 Tax=Schistocerca cancellata TaxID=274614 RepID=UPI002118F17A|nr:protein ABHD13 [Schistocerca cancellata]
MSKSGPLHMEEIGEKITKPPEPSNMGVNISSHGARIFRILLSVAMRCWALAGAAILACLLLYWAYGGLLAFMLLCFATTGILYHTEDNLLFHPELPAHSRVFVPIPSMFGLPYENLFIRSGDGTLLHMYFVRQPGEVALKAPTILFLHGNAGNMGHRLQNIVGLYQNLQCNILMLEYRGYGLSHGSPSEEGLYTDARAALNFLSSRCDINHKEIIVFGRSLGGAVAIDVASSPDYSAKIWCLIVENTFTSIPDMAKVLIGWRILQYLPLCFYKNKFVSTNKIGCVPIPTLFLSGLADRLVPPQMMTDLHQRCGSHHKQLIQFANGSHNETWTNSGYYHAIATFLRDVRVRHSSPPVAVPCDIGMKTV